MPPRFISFDGNSSGYDLNYNNFVKCEQFVPKISNSNSFIDLFIVKLKGLTYLYASKEIFTDLRERSGGTFWYHF